MQFDSFAYLGFFPIVFVLYHLLRKSFRTQNLLISVASLVFYSWFDARLTLLLLAYAVVGYGMGLVIHRTEPGPGRRRLTGLTVALLLLGLGIFKYLGFFQESFSTAVEMLGFDASWPMIEILLPIGLSFYCFQSIAYVVDVHRGLAEPERSFVTYVAFMFFFAQLVAGPIERASHLLDQFQRPRTVGREQAREGVWLLLWGFFLKVVVADTLGGFVDVAFVPRESTTAMTVLTGTIAFNLQIYSDFNAYSLIAKGSAALLGIDLVWNFDRPFWSRSVQEFWRRWHISLGTWLRDYLYIPLGGSRRGAARTYVNLAVTMTLGGLWHGAAWTFVVWGALHGLALAVHRLYQRRGRPFPMPGWLSWAVTTGFVFAAFFLFRAPSLAVAGELLSACGRFEWIPFEGAAWRAILLLSIVMFSVEAYQMRKGSLAAPAKVPAIPFAILATGLLLGIVVRFGGTPHQFIYFQF